MVLEFGQGYPCFGSWLPRGLSQRVMSGNLGSGLDMGNVKGGFGGFRWSIYDWILSSGEGWGLGLEFRQGLPCFVTWIIWGISLRVMIGGLGSYLTLWEGEARNGRVG